MNDLIVVRQLPIIEEQLHALKTLWEQRAFDAESMVCTEDTIQAVKGFRAEMRKEFDSVEALRKQAKRDVLDPYNKFEAVYKDCVTDAFLRADMACAQKVRTVEDDMKRRCDDGLREYFDELCAVHHLDWLEYERAGIKVDMASAKAKTPKKLREQLVAFVASVADSVNRINSLGYADEIMAEYRRTLDAAGAICTVRDRHRRIEEERAAREARYAELEQEAEAVRRVEALAPPVVSPAQEKTIKVSLVLRPTRRQFEDKIKPLMRQIKEICDMEGIKYE